MHEMEVNMEQERFQLRNARHLAADYMKRTIRPGDTVVDATMGNGKDKIGRASCRERV